MPKYNIYVCPDRGQETVIATTDSISDAQIIQRAECNSRNCSVYIAETAKPGSQHSDAKKYPHLDPAAVVK